MNKQYILAALVGISALSCNMPSFAGLTDAQKSLPTKPFSLPAKRPSQFKAGLFYGALFPTLVIPRFFNDCVGKTKDDRDFSFAKGFSLGFTASVLTLSVGAYSVYKCFKA